MIKRILVAIAVNLAMLLTVYHAHASGGGPPVAAAGVNLPPEIVAQAQHGLKLPAVAGKAMVISAVSARTSGAWNCPDHPTPCQSVAYTLSLAPAGAAPTLASARKHSLFRPQLSTWDCNGWTCVNDCLNTTYYDYNNQGPFPVFYVNSCFGVQYIYGQQVQGRWENPACGGLYPGWSCAGVQNGHGQYFNSSFCTTDGCGAEEAYENNYLFTYNYCVGSACLITEKEQVTTREDVDKYGLKTYQSWGPNPA